MKSIRNTVLAAVCLLPAIARAETIMRIGMTAAISR